MSMFDTPDVSRRMTAPTVGPDAVGFTGGHHFAVLGGTGAGDVDVLADAAPVPLSVILQVTKRCNFDCTFCSETLQLPDPTLDELDRIRANLSGVARVFLSGGEPLLRRDFAEIVDMYAGFIIGVPTNATRGLQHARNLLLWPEGPFGADQRPASRRR